MRDIEHIRAGSLSVAEAQRLILRHARSFGTEQVALEESAGRVLSRPVVADRDYPPFNRSAMDGYAIRISELKSRTSLKIAGALHAGEAFAGLWPEGSCLAITTGAPVPGDADAVVRTEDVVVDGGRIILSASTVTAGRNIALRGEDVKEGETLAPPGVVINGPRQALLAATGAAQVTVARLPRVMIYATGNEVRPVVAPVAPHQIRDSNSYALSGLLRAYALRARLHPPVADDPSRLADAFRAGVQADIMIVTAGVSGSTADHVPQALEALRVRKLFHGVSIRPGRPLWAGVADDGTMVFALPGNPAAVQVAFKVFIEPYIRTCLGMTPCIPCYFPLDKCRPSRGKVDEYFPVVWKERDRRLRACGVAWNGSGDITATARSAGIALHPAGTDGLQAGELVACFPWTSCF